MHADSTAGVYAAPRARRPLGKMLDAAHGFAAQPRVAALVSAWLVTSLAALFLAKHVLAAHPVSEATFTLFQFASSVVFGLTATKALRLHALDSLSRRQLRMIVPLSAAFLAKELLKYAAIARVSVNLINAVRSLGPVIAIGLEVVFLKHLPPTAVLVSMLPIVGGVALTSLDEMHAAGTVGNSFFVFLLGLAAALLSTVINQGQNMYSKVLFGAHKIDPVSLQIYLSGISLALLGPLFCLHSVFRFVSSPASAAASAFAALPSLHTALLLVFTGFVNFLSSQLAFSTLSKISPVSYSVANTLKRVCIAVVAIVFFGERVSFFNGSGIAISIIGVSYYESASRDYKAAKLYRQAPTPSSATITITPSSTSSQPQLPKSGQATKRHEAARERHQHSHDPPRVAQNTEDGVGDPLLDAAPGAHRTSSEPRPLPIKGPRLADHTPQSFPDTHDVRPPTSTGLPLPNNAPGTVSLPMSPRLPVASSLHLAAVEDVVVLKQVKA